MQSTQGTTSRAFQTGQSEKRATRQKPEGCGVEKDQTDNQQDEKDGNSEAPGMFRFHFSHAEGLSHDMFIWNHYMSDKTTVITEMMVQAIASQTETLMKVLALRADVFAFS